MYHLNVLTCVSLIFDAICAVLIINNNNNGDNRCNKLDKLARGLTNLRTVCNLIMR